MTTTIAQSGIFRDASPVLLRELRVKNEQGKITFLLPTKYVSEESAKLGLLLNHLHNKRRAKKTIYRTFFASCHWETISGTVKIMRHNHWEKTKKSEGYILVYDPSGELSEVFNPFNDTEKQPLVPGLRIETSFDLIKKLIRNNESLIGVILCWDGILPVEEVDALFAICKSKGIYTALDEALLEDWYSEHTRHIFSFPPDIFILGENIANREVPFASFSMTAEIYEPWNNITQCLAHSSSYTGNTIALSMVLATIEKHGLAGPEKFITGNRKAKFKAYADYVNPAIAWIFYVTRLSPEVTYAKGSWLKIENSKEEILDGIAGSGCCLRGHNPSDLVEVLDSHDSSRDYWQELCEKLKSLTPFSYVFPAVSGSSAVDIGIILALLAKGPRKRIVTFNHNYSGKSLISLNVTRFEYFRTPFHPLYLDVLEIDLSDEHAAEKLEKELLSGDIALVWFEILQGQNLDMIPDEILNVINKHKEKGDYLVGVDEILTGFYRTGNFLCSEGKVLHPDIITLAKGVSDMSFPMACVLVSEQVYQHASIANSELVEKLKTYFINQIGSHIALHGLEKAIEMDLGKHVREMGDLFKKLAREIVAKSPFHKEVRGEGLLLYLKLNKKAFPINILQEEFVEFLMSSQYLDKGKVLFLNSRLTPSLTINRREIELLCERIKRTLEQKNSLLLFFFCLKQILRVHFLCAWHKWKERFVR